MVLPNRPVHKADKYLPCKPKLECIRNLSECWFLLLTFAFLQTHSIPKDTWSHLSGLEIVFNVLSKPNQTIL